jgi:hypothetical protein
LEQQVFSDGLGSISVIGGTVRLDFVVFSPTERDANGQPQPVFCHRIIMGADTFLRAAEKMNEAAQAVAKRVASARPATEPPVPPAQHDEGVAVPKSGAPSPQITRPFP